MTYYEQGFLAKCASAGLSKEASVRLLKQAVVHLPRGLHWTHHFLPFETDVDQRRAARAAERNRDFVEKPVAWLNNGPDTPVSANELNHPFNVGRIALNVPGPLPAGSESNRVHNVGTSILERGVQPRELVFPSKNGFGDGYFEFVDNGGTDPVRGKQVVNEVVADSYRKKLKDK